MKRNCASFRTSMVDAADGCLTGDEKLRFEAHLRQCGRCAATFEGMLAVKRTVAVSMAGKNAMADPYLDSRILATVQERIRDEEETRTRRFKLLPVTGLVTAASAVIVTCFLLFSIPGRSMDTGLVDLSDIEGFILSENDMVSSYISQPTASARYSFYDSFYNYLENHLAVVDEKSFEASCKYMESNLKELI